MDDILSKSLKILTGLMFFVVVSISSATVHSKKTSISAFKVNVIAKKVTLTNVPTNVDSIGSLFAKKTIKISPEIPGKISHILFQYGQVVKKGQPLYQLDDQLYQAQYQAAQSKLHLSRITYQRTQQLAKKNAVSKETLDKALASYKSQESDLEVNKVKLEKMRITALFSGIISASKVDAGQFVEAGEPLAILIDKVDLIVKFSIPERYLNHAKIGQSVNVTSSALSHKIFRGKVSYIAPSVDAKTRTVMIWADIPNRDMKLAAGLFVHVTLQIGRKNNIVLIPQKALIPTVEGNDVFIIKHNKAYKRPVTIGRNVGEQIIIKHGLQAGDQVVILGQEKLANGRAVKVDFK